MRRAILAALLAAGCAGKAEPTGGGEEPKADPPKVEPRPEPKKPTVYLVGQQIRIGDAAVKVTKAKVRTYNYVTDGGDLRWAGAPQLVVEIEVTSANPDRIVEAGSQGGAAVAVDDKENKLDEVVQKDEYGRPANVYEQKLPRGKSQKVRAGEKAFDVVMFEKPAPTATAVILSLDAKKYGGAGRVLVGVDKDEWFVPPPGSPGPKKK